MNNKTWVLTLDTTLPEVTLDEGQEPLVLTIDALLQWLSIGFVEKDTDYAKIFSDVLTERLLPPQRFFKIEDFKIFSSLEKDVKELPKEDILGCIQHIRENIGTYNLSKAVDREKLHYEIDKFFKRSDLKYKENLIQLNDDLEAQKEEHKKTKGEFEEYKSRTEDRINNLETEKETIQEDFKELRNIFRRLGKSAAFFLAILIGLNILMFLIFNLISAGYYEEISLLEVETYLFLIAAISTLLFDIRNHKVIYKLKDFFA